MIFAWGEASDPLQELIHMVVPFEWKAKIVDDLILG